MNINNENSVSYDESRMNLGAIASNIGTVYINNHHVITHPLASPRRQRLGKLASSRILDAKWKKCIAVTIGVGAICIIIICGILKSKNIIPYQQTQSVYHTSSIFLF